MKTFVFTCLLSIFLLPSCRATPIRVGAPNRTASVTLTTLQTTSATLDEVRKQIESGAIPASIKPVFNTFAAAYTTAKASFQAYDKALGTPQYSDKLLTDLKVAMAALESASLQFDASMKGK